jgi:hypothetical protein
MIFEGPSSAAPESPFITSVNLHLNRMRKDGWNHKSIMVASVIESIIDNDDVFIAGALIILVCLAADYTLGSVCDP